MCAFLFQLKFSEGVDCCVGEEPPPSNLRRDHTGAGIPREARLCRKTMNDMCKQLKNMEHEWTWLCHIMAYHGILSFFRMKFLWHFLKSLQVTTSQGSGSWPCRCWGWIRSRLSGAYPWRIHGAAIYMPYMVTWIPWIYPSHVNIYTSTMDPSWGTS